MKHRTRHHSSTGGRRRRRRRGRGKVWNWIKNAARSVGSALKSSKVLSTVAPTVLGAVPGLAPYAGAAADAIKQAGYGRRRRTGRMPAALAAYWAKKRGGRRRRHRRRGRGMPVSLGTQAMSTYPWQTSSANLRL